PVRELGNLCCHQYAVERGLAERERSARGDGESQLSRQARWIRRVLVTLEQRQVVAAESHSRVCAAKLRRRTCAGGMSVVRSGSNTSRRERRCTRDGLPLSPGWLAKAGSHVAV